MYSWRSSGSLPPSRPQTVSTGGANSGCAGSVCRRRPAGRDAGHGSPIQEHLRTATAAPLDDERYRSLFAQWDGAEGQALYLRNIRCLDERDTEAVEERLSTVTVPTAVIWGADDAWLPADLSHRIAARIGAPPPTVIPDAGHFCMLDQPQAVTDALRAFLRETRAAAA